MGDTMLLRAQLPAQHRSTEELQSMGSLGFDLN